MTFEVPNTLALRSRTKYGGVARSVTELRDHRASAERSGLEFVVLGEGSNVVPSEEVSAYVCVNKLLGVEVLQGSAAPRLRVGAGENWHELVKYCTQNGYYGLENLALIPGSVGAAPIQNIGAYGVEVAAFIDNVEILDERGEIRQLSVAECEFSYRDSLFKRQPDLTVLAVTFELTKEFRPNLTYPDVAARAKTGFTPEELLEAVVDIRRSKLPDPNEVPNAGSFFKNPIVTEGALDRIRSSNPSVKAFAEPTGWKLSAAQLIDLAGWKSQGEDRVACWETQPLVIVNRGGATSTDILRFAQKVQADIAQRFQVQLELEPSVLS